MKRQSNTIYEDEAICLSCWSSPKQEVVRVQESRVIGVDKDKKKSLRKQTATQRVYPSNMPIKDMPSDQDQSKTARLSTNPQITNNHYETAHHYHPTPTSQTPSYLSHHTTPHVYFQDTSHKDRTIILQNCLLLTETTKLEKSIPNLNEELIKTKKIIPQIRKGSTSLLHGRQSVCSFTENFDPVENIEESEILQDYFNPTEAQMKEMKILYRIGQSGKNSINLLE